MSNIKRVRKIIREELKKVLNESAHSGKPKDIPVYKYPRLNVVVIGPDSEFFIDKVESFMTPLVRTDKMQKLDKYLDYLTDIGEGAKRLKRYLETQTTEDASRLSFEFDWIDNYPQQARSFVDPDI